jgi:tRNA-Thr(GGU) m(6)t(6)A37 methyltransferase TsaA
MAHALSVVAIGVVRSTCRERQLMPGEGLAAQIEVYPEYAGEVAGIEITSHLVVLGWLHQARLPLQTPSRRQRLPDVPARGVFATRSPDRPNPISMSVVRLVARHGTVLDVEGLDLIDGTPVLDLKPYLPGLDSVFGAVRAWRSRTNRGHTRLAGYLEQEVRNHMGPLAGNPEVQRAVEAVLLAAEQLGVDPRDPALSAIVNRAGATADVLMALLGATLASGRVAITGEGDPLTVQFAHGERSLRLRKADTGGWTASPG